MAVKKYNIIYADPPWSYTNKRSGGYKSGAEFHYNTLANADIINFQINHIIDDNAALFLWATVPLLPEAFKTIDAWGFKYKTMLTWRKVMSLGMGYYFRGQTEHLLVGVRGKVKAWRLQVPNFYQCKAGKHRQKPHYFRDLISKAADISFTDPSKLELFARSRSGMFPDIEYEGWDVYGNEVNNSITI